MNSEITLTNYASSSASAKGQIRLLYRRSDVHNAVLSEHGGGAPRYFLATSEDGVRKVKIRDAAGKAVAKVERRSLARDIFKFADRYEGKAVKVNSILRPASSTSEGRRSMVLDTPVGVYHWRKTRPQYWMLYEEASSLPVAWTEYVPGSAPTWALVADARVESILDYILASLFYVKFDLEGTTGWEQVDSRTAYFSMK